VIEQVAFGILTPIRARARGIKAVVKEFIRIDRPQESFPNLPLCNVLTFHYERDVGFIDRDRECTGSIVSQTTRDEIVLRIQKQATRRVKWGLAGRLKGYTGFVCVSKDSHSHLI